MLYTVHYTKKNSFMREKGMPRMIHKKDGEIVSESRYVRPTTPKAIRVYYPHKHYRKNVFLVDLEQKELDKLVKDIGFYDDEGRLITSAPLRNPNAPFWKHKDLKIQLEGKGTTFDDENPIDKFWLACFRADTRFVFSGEDTPPSLASRIQYTVSKVTEDVTEKAKTNEQTYEAIKLLTVLENDFPKMVSVLRAMGTNVKNPDPIVVRNALMRKITELKDVIVRGTTEKNIEMFIRLAKGSTEALVMKSLITEARSYNIITKNKSNNYLFGDLILGKSLQLVEDYLNSDANIDVRNEIIEKVKSKK